MKYLFLFLFVPTILFAQQHRPRFERLNDGWIEMGKSDTITHYIDPSSIRFYKSYRSMVSRLVVHRKDVIVDNVAQLIHNCTDSTYGVLRAVRKVDGHVIFAIDKGQTKDINWMKVEPNTFADIEFKYLCTDPKRSK